MASNQRRFVVGGTVAVVLLLITGVILVLHSGSSRSSSADDGFVAVSGRTVPSTDVVAEVDNAVAGLLVAPFVHIESTGFGDGERADISIDLDAKARAISWTERSGPVAAIGDPPPAAITVSQYVVTGSNIYVRVIPPSQDPNQPFQVLDSNHQTETLVRGGYTELGRVFDSLDVLTQVLGGVPFDAERLPDRTIAGQAVRGVRAVFAAAAVQHFLGDRGLEVVGNEGVSGSTSFEFWYTPERLVRLVATGTQFQDGEGIAGAAVRITYSVETAGEVTPPSNTVSL